jgi:Ca2+/Na+ antiporter
VQTTSIISTSAKAVVAILACIVSLVVGSYAMVTSLEKLAAILHIPNAIVGATVSAAGTSLPSLISSQIAARLGLGNMAISNVFGSNTFNILVGLGFPWILYTIAYDTEYHDLPADGVNESMIVMGVALALFIFMVVQSGFVLLKWHAWIFNIVYVLFIVHSIGKCFV